MLPPSVTARILRGPVGRLAALAAAGVAPGCALVLGLTGVSSPAMALAFGGYVFGVALAMALIRHGFPHPTLGLCNVVTLARLAMAASLLAPLVSPGAHSVATQWAVFAIATVALALDGVDGWLARREGRVSSFGARFDMEVDSVLALILALNVWAAGTAGVLVLVIGLPRYVFLAASVALPWLNRALPDRFSRKAVCVLQVGALILLQLPILPYVAAMALIALVAAALLWSFGRDVVWLWRHRA